MGHKPRQRQRRRGWLLRHKETGRYIDRNGAPTAKTEAAAFVCDVEPSGWTGYDVIPVSVIVTIEVEP